MFLKINGDLFCHGVCVSNKRRDTTMNIVLFEMYCAIIRKCKILMTFNSQFSMYSFKFLASN